MQKRLLLCLMLLYCWLAKAQSQAIAGLITNGSDRLSHAVIKNTSTRRQTLSNDLGQFTINATKGDTLVISKTDYVNDTLSIENDQSLIVQLKRVPTMLKEVVVNGTAITPASVYDQNKKDYKDIYFKGDKSNMIGTSVGLGFGVNLNIDKLYSALSKQGKDARRMQRTLTSDYRNSVVDKRFNPIAARISGYRGKQLSDFIKDNRPAYEMVIKATDYDLVQYIRKKLPVDKNTI